MINKKDMEARKYWYEIAFELLSKIEENDKDEEIRTDMCKKKTQIHFVLERIKEELINYYEDIYILNLPSLWNSIGVDDCLICTKIYNKFFNEIDIESIPIWIDALIYVNEFLFTQEQKISAEAWDTGRLYI